MRYRNLRGCASAPAWNIAAICAPPGRGETQAPHGAGGRLAEQDNVNEHDEGQRQQRPRQSSQRGSNAARGSADPQ